MKEIIKDYIHSLSIQNLPAYVDIKKLFDTKINLNKVDVYSTFFDLLKTANICAKKINPHCFAIIYLDFKCSDKLITKDIYEKMLVMDVERVLLYLMQNNEYLVSSGELYVLDVSDRVKSSGGYELKCACFRDKESVTNEWEYTVGLYITEINIK